MSSVAASAADGSDETTLTTRKRKRNPPPETPTSQLLPEDNFNISQEFLRLHRELPKCNKNQQTSLPRSWDINCCFGREQMEWWLGSEWNRLIMRQESAVDAVKLEWLMKGSLSAADVEAAKADAREKASI